MAGKVQSIIELAQETLLRITGSVQEWESFLDSAAWLYKYPFHEQTLIYAQRPDARACASFELWNDRMRRWINRGAKGIALIDDSGEKPSLKYVFDVSDTRPMANLPFRLWEMREQDEEKILEELVNHFGEIEERSELPFSDRLFGVISNTVTDNLGDYFDGLLRDIGGSMLEGQDELEISADFQRLVENSVHYCLLARLGYSPREYYAPEEFGDVIEFHTPALAAHLGSAAGDISEMLLRQIERTELSLLREERGKLAKPEEVSENEEKQENERSKEYGDHIQREERTNDPRTHDAAPAAGEYREIREDAQDIPARPQERAVQQSASERKTDGTPDRGRPESPRDRGTGHNEDGAGRGRDGGAESVRSHEVDGPDEQSEAGGGGSGDPRPHIQLTETERPEDNGSPGFLLQENSPQEQLSLLETEPGFTLPQQIVDEALCLGGNKRNSVLRICAKFKKDKGLAENAAFLREEYGTGGRGFYTDNQPVSMWFDGTGVRIVQGRSVEKAAGHISLTWEQAAKRVMELLTLGRYLPKKELKRADEAERAEIAGGLYFFFRDDYQNLPQEWKAEGSGAQEVQAHIIDMLSREEGIEDILQRLRAAIEDFRQDPPERRILHDPERLLQDVSDLKRIPLVFETQETARELPRRFITDDEIAEFFQNFIHVTDNKYRTYLYFQKERSNQERGKFLSEIFGTGGSYPGMSGTDDSGEWHDRKGIALSRGSIAAPYDKVLISWTKAAKYIGSMIEQYRYLPPEEKAYLPEYERKEAEREQKQEEARLLREAEERIAKRTREQERERRESAGYDYSLGTEVFLSTGTHTILGITDDAVTVNDEKYPLLTKEIPRGDFDRMLRQDSRNDGLMTESQEATESPYAYAVNDTVYLDGTAFRITQITDNEVQLLDPALSHPVFRAENKETFQHLLEQDERNAKYMPEMSHRAIVKTNLVEDSDDVPESTPPQKQQAENYRITNDELGYGGKKEKFSRNIAAICILQTIEKENRAATPDEQEALAQYVGWGGIPEAFDEHNDSWKTEYAELKGSLSETEYESARASVLNAHYTSPTVIRAIYDCIAGIGFETGNILEPSCGTGNFFGMLPDPMTNSKLYGIELDSITGRIAKQLYPNAEITVQSYEHTNLPDSFFDLAIGNVPFGNYRVSDKRYDKNKFSIHDYFFAKTLDKVRPGGIIAFVVSRFTMDKKDSSVRKYIAERADFLGAVRLPNNAFSKNAGTEVTADILFLQKRDRPQAVEPDWIHTQKTEDGYSLNAYFIDHPEMVLGTLSTEHTQYGGKDVKCVPIPGADLGKQLKEALSHIDARITDYDVEFPEQDETESIPADPNVRNYSYTLHDGKIYFRENSRMNRVDVSLTAENRIRGMIGIRDCMRRLIDVQMENGTEEEVRQEQRKLNSLYDSYTKKYGLLNSRGNSMAFSDDSTYFLICSLEILDADGKLKRKADMFSKRTIRQPEAVTSVDTAQEALTVSLAEKAKVDLPYMEQLAGISGSEIVRELRGIIFRDFGTLIPEEMAWDFFDPEQFPLVTAGEYLSGNVRAKLKQARGIYKVLQEHGAEAGLLDTVRIQVEALEKVQPKDLSASEIDVRLGATWLPPEYVEQFIYELLKPSPYLKTKIHVRYSPSTALWNISNKNWDDKNIAVTNTYGTKRVGAYKIIEETLNLKDVRVFDKRIAPDGTESRVLNVEQTMIAQQKQQTIKDEFHKWVWADIDRRDALIRIYNEKLNAIRPREYDGSHLRFPGMNPEIRLKEHQLNAVARTVYGGNTLLAHVVGAGKTYEMTAAAMELKRLGLCQKSLFVVPNHLTGQWGAEFLQLYPSANILVATKKDFETANRKKFCARIASGDYDAVIIGHSQFEKIPLSMGRQIMMIKEQIAEIVAGIAELKEANGERFTIKQMEKSKKRLEDKLVRLTDTSRKDDVVTFEELGVDRLFVDEAHFYKNLFLFTKMRNVAGLSQTEAQKSADLFGKTRYLDEITGGRGTVFATGTPISNSMTELYTMQRYLQYSLLQKNDLVHFDAWASTFGETVTALELKPEGTGYRLRTRFARFYNLPELLAMFKECADIRTADTLDLPVPEANYHTVVTKPSDFQKEMVAEFADRADVVRSGKMDPTIDNMLKITNDGRKLALDQRILNSMLEDDPQSKINACVENILKVYRDTADQKGTQLVFSDLSTPQGALELTKDENGVYSLPNGFSNVYEDIRVKLLNKGIPRDEIAFIHEANTDAKKIDLFSKVRSGKVRILMGSTSKMGAGTNVQDRLAALHHVDVPWRPADIEQREGRAIRQGNNNESVDIFRYVTENTFDAYMWQTIESKQKYIGQIMTSKAPVRSCEDVDEAALSYAEVKMLATGNPYIKEKMDLDIAVSRLRLLQSDYLSRKYELEDKVAKHYPVMIEHTKETVRGLKADMDLLRQHQSEDFPGMEIEGVLFKERAAAGAAIVELCKRAKDSNEREIGTYKGFKMLLSFDTFDRHFKLNCKGTMSHVTELGADALGNMTRIENTLKGVADRAEANEEKLQELRRQMENAKEEIGRPFKQEQELKEKTERLTAVNALLNLGDATPEAVDTTPEETQEKTQEIQR